MSAGGDDLPIDLNERVISHTAKGLLFHLQLIAFFAQLLSDENN